MHLITRFLLRFIGHFMVQLKIYPNNGQDVVRLKRCLNNRQDRQGHSCLV